MEDEDSTVKTFQDLGEVAQSVRFTEECGPRGVASLIPDDGSHIDAMGNIRDIIDEYYGDNIDRIADDDQRVIIERLVVPSDDLPYIEYQLVDDREV